MIVEKLHTLDRTRWYRVGDFGVVELLTHSSGKQEIVGGPGFIDAVNESIITAINKYEDFIKG